MAESDGKSNTKKYLIIGAIIFTLFIFFIILIHFFTNKEDSTLQCQCEPIFSS
jgi:hypothetical protein